MNRRDLKRRVRRAQRQVRQGVATLGEVARWLWYRRVTQPISRLPLRMAKRLPRWLKYWVLIDVGARYTTSDWCNAAHPMTAELGAMLDFEHNRRPQHGHY